MGPATYEVFEKNMDLSVEYGAALYSGIKNREKVYNSEYYIYPVEHPKKCVWGYLVKRNDPKKTIVGWKIISGKENCKEQQGYILSF
jgi:hypothetical protein